MNEKQGGCACEGDGLHGGEYRVYGGRLCRVGHLIQDGRGAFVDLLGREGRVEATAMVRDVGAPGRGLYTISEWLDGVVAHLQDLMARYDAAQRQDVFEALSGGGWDGIYIEMEVSHGADQAGATGADGPCGRVDAKACGCGVSAPAAVRGVDGGDVAAAISREISRRRAAARAAG